MDAFLHEISLQDCPLCGGPGALYEEGGGTTTLCRILDVDEEWVRILRNEGKKNQREMLVRLSDVKQIKG